ncbi:hypothetical protein K2173_025358 [Erythroxylum novogranatense]|uniref:Uncharacterized protein n=1 Tax=Erythroxylum novogranatense TaxID=1862640 RepID=A0AAV8UIT0_9ROSI|nr:hypothetical protein K2173_025358 [Erythroxylum novogranatense]
MASVTFSDTSSSTTARLIPFCWRIVRRNDVLFLRQLVGHLSHGPFTPLRPLSAGCSSTTPAPVIKATLMQILELCGVVDSSKGFSATVSEGSAEVIDGKMEAKQTAEEIASEVSRMKDAIGVVRGLAVPLVGDRKDSATYVRKKKKAYSSEHEVINLISGFNDDLSVHGIPVQLPLPPENVLKTVSIGKDADGFHPVNIGQLAIRGREPEPMFVTCNGGGGTELLYRYGVQIKGKKAGVIGRKEIFTIVISVVGRANSVSGSCIKPNCISCHSCSPVPGGVGPMTIAILHSNTLSSAKRENNFFTAH